MRVIAGKYRSRRLIAPAGVQTRPTSDRLRETLFNVVGASVPDSVWLDLFAGTGAVGIEALSRGARMVYFVESSNRAARVIRANLDALEITQGFEVVERDAMTTLRLLEAKQVAADLCFLDPPYRQREDYEQVLSFISRSSLLKAGGMVIAEHDKRLDPGESFGTLRRYRKLRQGDAVLSFYRREKPPATENAEEHGEQEKEQEFSLCTSVSPVVKLCNPAIAAVHAVFHSPASKNPHKIWRKRLHESVAHVIFKNGCPSVLTC